MVLLPTLFVALSLTLTGQLVAAGRNHVEVPGERLVARSRHNDIKPVQKSSSTSAAAAPLPSGWTSLGCVTDNSTRLLYWQEVNVTNTPAACMNDCAFHGYVYAGTEYGTECWCGSELDNTDVSGLPLPASDCTVACPGDPSQTCGDAWKLNLYHRTSLPATTYKSATVYAGSSFFTGWDFYTQPDPTGGSVAYQSKSAAQKAGLFGVTSEGLAMMKVDNKTVLQPGQNRASVRITSQKSWTEAMFIFDVVNMPWGCSVWPALWTVGPNWPYNGEIDVIEGINNVTHNQITFHTGPDTTCNTTTLNPKWVSNSFGPGICASNATADSGCGFVESSDPAQGTYGQGFNAVGGGVYALKLDSVGARVWRWTHDQVPSDVKSGHGPRPDDWGLPAAMVATDKSCDVIGSIQEQSIVIDTTLCGGWCADNYVADGCGQTCTERIPIPTNYDNAYWLIKNITVWE